MKIRYDFVTNSSSSSFLISKKYLDYDQIRAIRDHHRLGEKMGFVESWLDYPWNIKENNDFIAGYTSMDNFDMESFLNKIEVNMRKVTWGEQEFMLSEDDGEEFDWRRLLYED
jgi:hypothetical protein